MAKKTVLACLLAAFFLAPSVSRSQSPIPWAANLESAQQAAGQTNRLVLIHFWAPWCVVCKRMEANVLLQPSVAATLNAGFVPVKINADQFPATAVRYGVTALPTTIVISPDGQMIDSMRGWVDVAPLVQRLNQIALAAQQRRAAVVAQIPSNPPTQPAAAGPASNGSSPPPIASTPSQTPSPAAANPSPAFGAPAAATPRYCHTIAPAATPPAGSRFATTAAPAAQPPVQPQLPPQNAPPQNPVASAPPSQTTPPPANPTAPPKATEYPIALDGFCPVALCEKLVWVNGDRRWGAIHRGRTYLFAGAEEQRRFLANPDRYAPVISGNDVVLAIERGQAIPGKREHGVFYQGRVYLFADEASLQKFSLNPTVYDASRPLEALRSGANTNTMAR